MSSSSLLLVDGNNLLFKARDRLFSLAAGRGQICSVLAKWSRQNKIPVLVVFDGEPPRAGVVQQYQAGGVQVRFSRSRSADLVIEEIIAQSPKPAMIRVISSDKAILSAARRRRCSSTRSEEFVEELTDDGEVSPRADTDADRDPELTDEEIAEWMEDFGFDAEVPPVDDTDLMGPVEPLE